MTTLLDALIDKQDTYEIVGDQVALILANEVVNQMALAVLAAEDPTLWDMKIFNGRYAIIENYLNLPAGSEPTVPIVIVNYDAGSFDKNTGNIFETQRHVATFWIDCYGFGVAKSDGAGHSPSDLMANQTALRAARLVRNILMSNINVDLQLSPTVVDRWVQGIEAYQPQFSDRPVQNVLAKRVTLVVDCCETSPQNGGQPLELVAVDVKYDPEGAVILEADYDYT